MKKQLRLLMLTLLCAVFSTTWGDTTYKLEQVTSVEAGGLYVFEQDGYVMNNTVSSSALQTTDFYQTTGLSGTESYVWTLESENGGFYMKNVSLSSNQYLNNASKTNVSFGSKNSIWKFTFDDNNKVLIQNTSNNNRYLGYTSSSSYAYKAYATGDMSYSHAIKVYQLVEQSVNDVNPPSFTNENDVVAVNTVVTITADEGCVIKYTTDNTDPRESETATTSTGNSVEITLTETTTIQAVAKKGDNMSNVVEKTYTVVETVNGFYESFNQNEGSGGNDGEWSGSIADNNIVTDNSNWTFSSIKGGAYHCIKLGSGSAKGSAETPALRMIGNGVLTFKAGAWVSDEEGTTINVTISEGGSLSPTSVTLTKGSFNTYTINVSNMTVSSKIKFESAKAKNRFFLDEVIVSVEDPINVTISNAGYATLYYGQKSLVVPEGVTAYAVKVNGSNLNYTDVGNVIPAGTGVVLKGTPGEKLFYETTTNNTVTDNDLLGYDENHVTEKPAGAAETDNYLFYMLSGGTNGVGFYFATKDANGNDLSLENQNGGPFECLAHKAYLAVLNNGHAPSSFTFEDQTDINTVKTEVRGPEGVYTVTGVRMNSKNLPAGLYIVNGKKVIIK